VGHSPTVPNCFVNQPIEMSGMSKIQAIGKYISNAGQRTERGVLYRPLYYGSSHEQHAYPLAPAEIWDTNFRKITRGITSEGTQDPRTRGCGVRHGCITFRTGVTFQTGVSPQGTSRKRARSRDNMRKANTRTAKKYETICATRRNREGSFFPPQKVSRILAKYFFLPPPPGKFCLPGNFQGSEVFW